MINLVSVRLLRYKEQLIEAFVCVWCLLLSAVATLGIDIDIVDGAYQCNTYQVFWAKHVLRIIHAKKLLFLRFRRSSNVVIRFSHTDFFFQSNNLAIIRFRCFVFFHCTGRKSVIFVSGLFDLMTLNKYHMLPSALR